MWDRTSVGAATVLLASALIATIGGASAADDAKYPDLHGGWQRFVIRSLGGQPSFDQTRPWGFGQQAPLTADYRKVLEQSLADQAKGGQGNFIGHAQCLPAGMPFMMVATRPLDIVVTPYSTYVLVGGNDHYRRIYTDGRDWPKEIEPTYSGYSIGRWIDANGDGRYDLLEVETRGFKGPRAYDASGLPLDFDNQSIFRERIYVDRSDPNVLHDEITVVDHALTRPWTVDKRYIRRPNPHPEWVETYCTEGTALVFIGNEAYYVSGDGKLMPTKKDQPAPDLSYFKQKRP
ncbi:MAG TPA: hypothetical protein VH684_23800 [Xanthobacteraceae bacterium]